MQCDVDTLTVTYPAEPDSVAPARHALTTFAATAGADNRQLESVRLAVSEAITNAVLHAYRDTAGDVHVTAAHVADELWILVCDDGCGVEPRPDRPGLGLGLALIAQVSEEMSVGPRAGRGTEVRMRFALVHAARTAPARATSRDGVPTGRRDVVGPPARRVPGETAAPDIPPGGPSGGRGPALRLVRRASWLTLFAIVANNRLVAESSPISVRRSVPGSRRVRSRFSLPSA